MGIRSGRILVASGDYNMKNNTPTSAALIEEQFENYRLRLKNQTSAIKKELNIKTGHAYEVLSFTWGFDNWFEMNQYLKQIEQCYIFLKSMRFLKTEETLNPSDKTLKQVLSLHEFIMNSGCDEYHQDYVKGMLRALKVEIGQNLLAPQKNKVCNDIFEMIDYLADADKSFKTIIEMIHYRTSWNKSRHIVPVPLDEEVMIMGENLYSTRKDLTLYNIPDESDKREVICTNLKMKMFGVTYKPLSLEYLSYDDSEISDAYVDTFVEGFPLNSISENVKDSERRRLAVFGKSSRRTMLFSTLYPELNGANSLVIDYSIDFTMSIGDLVAYLPDEAVVTIEYDKASATFLLRSVSVKNRMQLSSLMMPAYWLEPESFDNSKHEADILDGDVIYADFKDGFTIVNDYFNHPTKLM